MQVQQFPVHCALRGYPAAACQQSRSILTSIYVRNALQTLSGGTDCASGPAAATHFEEAVIPNRNEVLLHAHVPHATLTPSSMSCLQCPHSVAESLGAPRSEGPNVASQFDATQPVDIDRGALRQVCAFDVTHRDS